MPPLSLLRQISRNLSPWCKLSHLFISMSCRAIENWSDLSLTSIRIDNLRQVSEECFRSKFTPFEIIAERVTNTAGLGTFMRFAFPDLSSTNHSFILAAAIVSTAVHNSVWSHSIFAWSKQYFSQVYIRCQHWRIFPRSSLLDWD
jgi:hypothetical protein